MPKVPRDNSRLSPSTQEHLQESKWGSATLHYLQQLRDTKEEKEVLDLLEPEYEYPVTNKVYRPVTYLKRSGKPYNFERRIAKATKHTAIDITYCPPATLAFLIDAFPGADISFSRTNLLIPYVPTTEALKRAYQVLPVDTVAKYHSI